MLHKLLFLGLIGLIFASGCTSQVSLDPLVGTWETHLLGFESTIQFNNDGTGTRASDLGITAFEWQKIDATHLNYRRVGSSDWDVVDYQVVNVNTLVFQNLTYTRAQT